jgi:hypothetical protein
MTRTYERANHPCFRRGKWEMGLGRRVGVAGRLRALPGRAHIACYATGAPRRDGRRRAAAAGIVRGQAHHQAVATGAIPACGDRHPHVRGRPGVDGVVPGEQVVVWPAVDETSLPGPPPASARRRRTSARASRLRPRLHGEDRYQLLWRRRRRGLPTVKGGGTARGLGLGCS